jgi:hypothetical protein
MSDEPHDDGTDTFAESLRLDARARMVQRITSLILAVALAFALGVLGTVTLVRGNTIAAGEEDRAVLRRELEALRFSDDLRAIEDACNARISGALQISLARTLSFILSPARDPAVPATPEQRATLVAELDRAIADRDAASELCDAS